MGNRHVGKELSTEMVTLRNLLRSWLGINQISMELHELRDMEFKRQEKEKLKDL